MKGKIMENTKQLAIEKLKNEFQQQGYMGKIIINNCLLPEIHNNPEFANRIILKNKSVKKALKTITEWIRLYENHAPSHNVMFSAVIHYYQEDDPKFVKEIFEEPPMVFGNIQKEFNTPIIKRITGTVIETVIKEVEKQEPRKKLDKSKITKKVNDDVDQLSIFEI